MSGFLNQLAKTFLWCAVSLGGGVHCASDAQQIADGFERESVTAGQRLAQLGRCVKGTAEPRGWGLRTMLNAPRGGQGMEDATGSLASVRMAPVKLPPVVPVKSEPVSSSAPKFRAGREDHRFHADVVVHELTERYRCALCPVPRGGVSDRAGATLVA